MLVNESEAVFRFPSFYFERRLYFDIYVFLKSTASLPGNPDEARCKLWQNTLLPATYNLPPKEHLQD